MGQIALGVRLKYSLLGTTSGLLYFMREPYFDYLRKVLPDDFRGKKVHDLGCGDGRTSLRLREYLEATSITVYEYEPRLVERARERGLDARRINLEEDMPRGEVVVLWGVLHHLRDKESVLRRIAEHYDYAVINEPVKAWWSFLDGGVPLPIEDWKHLFYHTLGRKRCEIYQCRDEVFVFWRRGANLPV